MDKKNFLIGMGMGLIVGGAVSMAVRPKKSSGLGKKLRTMGQVVDAFTNTLGL